MHEPDSDKLGCYPCYSSGVQLSINGENVKTDYEAYIVRATQTAYVPIRFVTEALGGTVSWDKTKQQVTTHSKDKKDIILTVRSNVAYVDGAQKVLPNSPQLTTPRVIVPVRFVSEVMGVQVNAYKHTDDVEHIDLKW